MEKVMGLFRLLRFSLVVTAQWKAFWLYTVMDRVHCGGVHNHFFARVKQIIIAKVYLWHFTRQKA